MEQPFLSLDKYKLKETYKGASKKKKKESCYYKLNTPYSITINFKDSYQFFNNINRVRKVKRLLHDILFNGYVKLHNIIYELHMEVSEPRGFHTAGYAGPRLHFHGTIEFKYRADLQYFLLFQYRAILKVGSVDIDTIEDSSVWKEYCTKQDILRVHPLIL